MEDKMVHQKNHLSLFFVFSLLVGITVAKTELLAPMCSNGGNYTKTSIFQTNLETALSFNTTNINHGFYNFSGGRNPDRVNVIGLCRGDVKPSACRSCLEDSSDSLRQFCPNQREAIGWADDCTIRYANRSILQTNETFPALYMFNFKNASDPTKFNKVVRGLLDDLRAKAAAGGSMFKYATGNANSTKSSETVFGLVQCTPDLSTAQCSDCLNRAFDILPQCCNGKIGGRVLQPSCNFRYEINRFYGETALTNAPPPQDTAPPPQATAPQPQDTAPPPLDTAPPPQATAPPPSDRQIITDRLPPPPPPQGGGGGGNRNLAVFSLWTLMAAVAALILIF